MPGKRRRAGQQAKGRSLAQLEESVAMAEVMMAWEELSDEERLSWRTDASTRRIEGSRALSRSIFAGSGEARSC
jgi:hypothetical protein